MTINKKEIAQVSAKYTLIGLQHLWKWFAAYLKWGVKNPAKFIVLTFALVVVGLGTAAVMKHNAYLASLTPEQLVQYKAEQADRDRISAERDAAAKASAEAASKARAIQSAKEDMAEDIMECAGVLGAASMYLDSVGRVSMAKDVLNQGVGYQQLAKRLDPNVNQDKYMPQGMKKIQWDIDNNKPDMVTYDIEKCNAVLDKVKANGWMN
ncbi:MULTISPECIES: hypothetical protein [Aeromonas]|uniref:hypothetical protein n=1 Tax=Aeromonas TaxID=642 RepID=UPI0005AB0E06|nr:hypothetical protein [Aeromonas allosaccharophila]